MTSTTARATGTTGMPYRKHEGIPGTYGTPWWSARAWAVWLWPPPGAGWSQKVLLLEQNNIVGGMTQAYSRHGYRWTVGMHYIGEVGNPNGAGWKLFNRVTGGHLRWAPMPAIYNRMVIADRGYDVPAGPQAYARFPHQPLPGRRACDPDLYGLGGQRGEVIRPVLRRQGLATRGWRRADAAPRPGLPALCRPDHAAGPAQPDRQRRADCRAVRQLG